MQIKLRDWESVIEFKKWEVNNEKHHKNFRSIHNTAKFVFQCFVSPDMHFKQPWNKLEKGMKMNRILLFVKKETELHELSTALSKELKDILFRGCENGSFNKVSEVKYNEEECMIESFKSLEYNESSKKYKLKSGGTKNRSVSKSRSNIDRLMKKK